VIARVAVALVVLVAAVPAQAGHDKRAAAAHFQRGRALFESGNWSAALDAFESGYEAYPLPGFLVNIGQCERKLERIDDAATSFQKFLDSDAGDAKLRGEVQEALTEIAAERSRREAAIAAEVEARRQRDEAERRHPIEEPSRASAQMHARALPLVPTPTSSMAVTTGTRAHVEVVAKPGKSHRWVWAIVGVLAAGAVAGAVTVAVIETQPAPTKPGSLGLLDGRR
jgi:tetratricopeptide (TPR) repeat protein